MSKHTQTSEFNLEGQFVGFAAEEGYKLKLIRVLTATGEYRVKVPKELRSSLYRTLVPGMQVQVSGYQKFDPAKGSLKLKADQVVPVGASSTASCNPAATNTAAFMPASVQPIASIPSVPGVSDDRPTRIKPATILVCQKSDCCKRGGNAVTRALQTELNNRGLAEHVSIRGTGCMKQCKAGPNLVMPDKSRYSRIRPEEVAALVDQHFPETGEIAS